MIVSAVVGIHVSHTQTVTFTHTPNPFVINIYPNYIFQNIQSICLSFIKCAFIDSTLTPLLAVTFSYYSSRMHLHTLHN